MNKSLYLILDYSEEAQFVKSARGHAQLVDKLGYVYNKHQSNKQGTLIWWKCREFFSRKTEVRCRARATTEGFFITKHTNVHTHPPQVEALPQESSHNVSKDESSE